MNILKGSNILFSNHQSFVEILVFQKVYFFLRFLFLLFGSGLLSSLY